MMSPRGHDRGLPGAAAGRSARGFTLIEIALALGILVGIASLGVPPLLRSFEERGFESASLRLEASLWSLATTAADEGVPRAVWIEPDASGVLTLRSVRVEPGEISGGVSGSSRDEGGLGRGRSSWNSPGTGVSGPESPWTGAWAMPTWPTPSPGV